MKVTTLPRPIWNDEIKKELAKIVGTTVNKWCNNETPLEDCIEDAEKILEYHSNDNGYELAKEFEDEGFTPDGELVELLDNVTYDKHKIQEDFIKKWVIENELKLDLIEGQKVIANLARKGEIECEIVKLYPQTMQYGLWNNSLGYEKGKGHTVINYENIVTKI